MSNEEIIAAINAGENRQQLMLALWQQNAGLINHTARRFRSRLDWDDIMQAAYIGLDAAVRRYNPAAGLFATFFPYWVQSAIQEAIADSAGVGKRASWALWAYDRDKAKLAAQIGREPTAEELRQYTGMTQEKQASLEQVKRLLKPSSLDAPIETEDGDSVTLSDVIEDTRDTFGETDEGIYQAQMKADLWGIVDALPDKQPEIIKARYIDGDTLEQAADRAGITKQEGRREETRAMRELRRGKARRLLLPYWEEIAGAAMQGVGYERFNQTWTSATEREALRLY